MSTQDSVLEDNRREIAEMEELARGFERYVNTPYAVKARQEFEKHLLWFAKAVAILPPVERAAFELLFIHEADNALMTITTAAMERFINAPAL